MSQSYFPVAMYTDHVKEDSEPKFVGYAIVREHAGNDVDELPFRLEGNHVYGYTEVEEMYESINRLNHNAALKEFWPDAKDSEVQALYRDNTYEAFPMNDRGQPLNDKGEVDWNIPYARLAKAQEQIAIQRREAANAQTP